MSQEALVATGAVGLVAEEVKTRLTRAEDGGEWNDTIDES